MSAVNRVSAFYEGQSRQPSLGRNFIVGIVIAALTVLTQIVLRRELAPGEFGTVNALFGLALVLLVPFAALSAVLRRELNAANASNLYLPLLNRSALGWSLICLVVLFVALPPMKLPRVSLQFFMLTTVGAGLLAICGRPATPARWCAFIGSGAALLRLVASGWFGMEWPSAESGLGALLLAGLLAGLPALRDQPDTPITGAWKTFRPSLVPALAAISVALALALFTNADRIAAQPNLGAADPGAMVNMPTDAAGNALVDYGKFDAYQAAGLCDRWILWGLLPMLALHYAQRSGLKRTTYASLRWFWIYLGALLFGMLCLVYSGNFADYLFNPPFQGVTFHTRPPVHSYGQIGVLLPQLSVAFFLLGLLQGIAIFTLASRRYVECFVLAACSLAYTAFVFHAGHQAQLLPGVMAGGALISLMLVLFVGVVRYARTHP
jgi:hypothetical protein